jgi:hypothetical protein
MLLDMKLKKWSHWNQNLHTQNILNKNFTPNQARDDEITKARFSSYNMPRRMGQD